ncbi:hypothetical protein PsYK624_146990 [Phanerochaete sordida]|uniref:Uncharacterized protein n=1 Tax=Phanerochaete sordida TaxID=48140 RepID=A0A9P3GN43_9APHY|nr:hypothetical protein PsYK624_146990 [Phanerochaete sordida]
MRAYGGQALRRAAAYAPDPCGRAQTTRQAVHLRRPASLTVREFLGAAAAPNTPRARRRLKISALSYHDSVLHAHAHLWSLQHVVHVHANSTGAFAALRVDARADAVCVMGRTLRKEIEGIVLRFGSPADRRGCTSERAAGSEDVVRVDGDEHGNGNGNGNGNGERVRDAEDTEDDPAVLRDQAALLDTHAQAVKDNKACVKGEPPLPSPLSSTSDGAHGADVLMHVLGGTAPSSAHASLCSTPTTSSRCGTGTSAARPRSRPRSRA